MLSQIKKSVENYAEEVREPTFIATIPDSQERAARIITDHTRSVTFMAADGVAPSNKDQGYVMRRLARRAIREALVLGIQHDLFARITPKVVALYEDEYPELGTNQFQIMEVLKSEEKTFRQTLARGLKKSLNGQTAFVLYDTYGFPKELSLEEAKRINLSVSKLFSEEFEIEMQKQKDRSRTATAGQFKGGLADDSEVVTRYHTATHLMYKALRNVLGEHVMQRGSNITAERMRFDFSHGEKMTPEQIKQTEDMVNDVIAKDLPLNCEEMGKDEAFEKGALGAFGEKYPDKVKVYTVGGDKDWYSKEICGGPHVKSTGEIGKFKIVKEESSSAGVRRIKAVIE
jgi:alanyl-tRNA synthetase